MCHHFNFVLYSVCFATFIILAERLNLKEANEYEYLKQSDCLTIVDVDDARRFHILMVSWKLDCDHTCIVIKFLECLISNSLFPSKSLLYNDLLSFQYDQEALDTVQICKEDQENAFAMLAAVLWLGNISFSVIDNENHVEVVADEGIEACPPIHLVLY